MHLCRLGAFRVLGEAAMAGRIQDELDRAIDQDRGRAAADLVIKGASSISSRGAIAASQQQQHHGGRGRGGRHGARGQPARQDRGSTREVRHALLAAAIAVKAPTLTLIPH
jgi:hypothetical protein